MLTEKTPGRIKCEAADREGNDVCRPSGDACPYRKPNG
jgi:hypothetical protein